MMYFWIFFFGTIGIMAQSILKIIKINDRTAKDVTIGDIVRQYMRSDFGWVLLSFILLAIWVSIIQATLATGPEKNPIPWIAKSYLETALRFINAVTAAVMYSSQSLIMMFTSKTEKFFKQKTE